MNALKKAMTGFVTVTVRQGALRGRRRKTPAGTSFLSFQGVPYAKPPLGELRFKAPEPAEPWTGIRDATKEGNPCVQYDPIIKQQVGEEDCLFLNVFTSGLPAGLRSERARAVMVWIHGGAFKSGSSNMYGPEPMMEHDVVLVTINYRVGPLGFLGLGTAEAPGNAGLKDQVMALRWVQENIAVFGGDPGNVTIFGESAGGASVHFLVLSPLAKGLFHRAVAQSGSAFCPWALSRDPLGRAQRLALAAGCPADAAGDPATLLAWYREVSPTQLLEAMDTATTAEERRRGLLAPFVPCVEPSHGGETFLPDEPLALMAAGAVPRIPIVFGVTSHEGIITLPGSLLRLSASAANEELATPEGLQAAEARVMADIACDMERVLPEDLLEKARGDPRVICDRVKAFYLDGQDPSEETAEGYVHLQSDLQFGLGVMHAARDHVRLGSPVFMYEFAFRGGLNFLGQLLGSRVKGVCHGDEMAYQFAMPFVPEPDDASPEALLRKRMCRMWTDFAKSGNPTPAQDEVITTNWLPYTESAPNYLKIGEELEMESGLWKERMQFWVELYRMYR